MTDRRIRVVDKKNGFMGIRFYEFPRDPIGVNPYNARRAYNGFFNNARTLYNETDEYWYDDNNILTLEEEREKWGELPTIKLNSIYEFFEAIGFDNKTKKYKKPVDK